MPKIPIIFIIKLFKYLILNFIILIFYHFYHNLAFDLLNNKIFAQIIVYTILILKIANYGFSLSIFIFTLF